VPVERLPHAVREGEWFDGSSVEGFARIFESDMFLRPELDTLSISSDAEPRARLLCDIVTPDGQAFPGDPRGVLKRTLADAVEAGYAYRVGVELEFFLLTRQADGQPGRPPSDDRAGYFDDSTDPGTAVRQEIVRDLDGEGILVEASHHELAFGQHELDLALDDALTAADRLVRTRATVKAVAQRHGLFATFMPKPFYGVAGSGMHTHQTLLHRGSLANAFSDRADEYLLSAAARHFIAGQLHHARALCAIVAPLVNSYKRLVPGFEAPVAVSWAQTNRSALIRVPRVSGADGTGIRIEFRAPDPACNPYLAFAGMLRAGLEGIRQKLPLPPPIEENLYAFDPERLSRQQLGLLPLSLHEALGELRRDDAIREALGPHVMERFIEAKERECQAYDRQVSAWETETYLSSY
jgi:glutamine synthetase